MTAEKAKSRRKLPNEAGFGPMRNRLGVRFSFAGAAFLNLYANRLEPFGLTPGRVLALSYIHEHIGCDQKSLARNLAINEASAMAVINRLEAAGWAERREGRNKRTKALHLTPAGEDIFETALGIEERMSEDILGWMGQEALDSFMAQVDEVRARSVVAKD